MTDPFLPRPHIVEWTGAELRTATTGITESLSDELAADAYRLDVTADGATLIAGSEQGLRYGRSTYAQLLDAATTEGEVTVIPGVHIEDAPTFSWRGLMVDCSRHFTPVAELEKIIDALVLHRMNRLHLHLTDDQGWRVQIDGWPLLTEVGAWRDRSLRVHHEQEVPTDGGPVWDTERHGGFYTQDDLRGLVAYADERGVVLVPEIDLPGHMQAAVAAYPELGNLAEPVQVRQIWGISDNVLAPTEKSFQLVRDVLTQIIDIFPSQWIHVGGDECPTVEWEQSEVAQSFMKDRGLSTERQIQREFMVVANEVISAAGRTLIGWDEILEAEPPSDAVAMLWRHESSVPMASEHGHKSVWAHSSSLYFDHYQADPATEPIAIGGLTTLADVYATQPLGEGATDPDRQSLLGVQCQLWREYIPTSDKLEYMIFPRLCALSEVAWGSRTDLDDFTDRLRTFGLPRLDALGIAYRPL